MKQAFYGVRPLLLSILVAGACNAMAAERVDLEKNLPAARTMGLAFGSKLSAANLLGLSTEELKNQRSKTYGNGKVVTRHQQFYMGVPIWSEAIVEHLGIGDTQPTMSGAMLTGLSNDLPTIRPTYNANQIVDLAKTKAQVFSTENEQAKLYIKQAENGVARLVYAVSFVAKNSAKPSRPSFMIDANSGAIFGAMGRHYPCLIRNWPRRQF